MHLTTSKKVNYIRKHAHAIYSDFHGCKNVNFQMKKNIIFFLFFAQNIDCGYRLEPPL